MFMGTLARGQRAAATRWTVVAAVLAACGGACEKERPVTKLETPPPVIDASPPRARVNLLRIEGAIAGVSSSTGGIDDPMGLVDDDLEYAWNSRTGDLVGAWVAWFVPESSHVERIELVVGFDAKGKKGEDLFVLNHRVKRVKLSREGAVLGEFVLDPNRRGFQGFDVSAPGGSFLLEIMELEPGTNPAWREVALSELKVLGTSDKTPRTGAPSVRIGTLDGVHFRAKDGIVPWLRTGGFDARRPSRCQPVAVLALNGKGPFLRGELLRCALGECAADAGTASECEATSRDFRVALQTRDGFVLSPSLGELVHSSRDDLKVREAVQRGEVASVRFVSSDHECGQRPCVRYGDGLVTCTSKGCVVVSSVDEHLFEDDEEGPSLQSWRSDRKLVIDDAGAASIVQR